MSDAKTATAAPYYAPLAATSFPTAAMVAAAAAVAAEVYVPSPDAYVPSPTSTGFIGQSGQADGDEHLAEDGTIAGLLKAVIVAGNGIAAGHVGSVGPALELDRDSHTRKRPLLAAPMSGHDYQQDQKRMRLDEPAMAADDPAEQDVPALEPDISPASALFRRSSSKAKKHTRPPVSKLYDSLHLSAEQFVHLQAAAKLFMLDPAFPERQNCIGNRAGGDSDIPRLRLFTSAKQFLSLGSGLRFFSHAAAGTASSAVTVSGSSSRRWVWPENMEEIIGLVTPLLRRIVTNERQRVYALESRKQPGRREKSMLSPGLFGPAAADLPGQLFGPTEIMQLAGAVSPFRLSLVVRLDGVKVGQFEIVYPCLSSSMADAEDGGDDGGFPVMYDSLVATIRRLAGKVVRRQPTGLQLPTEHNLAEKADVSTATAAAAVAVAASALDHPLSPLSAEQQVGHLASGHDMATSLRDSFLHHIVTGTGSTVENANMSVHTASLIDDRAEQSSSATAGGDVAAATDPPEDPRLPRAGLDRDHIDSTSPTVQRGKQNGNMPGEAEADLQSGPSNPTGDAAGPTQGSSSAVDGADVLVQALSAMTLSGPSGPLGPVVIRSQSDWDRYCETFKDGGGSGPDDGSLDPYTFFHSLGVVVAMMADVSVRED